MLSFCTSDQNIASHCTALRQNPRPSTLSFSFIYLFICLFTFRFFTQIPQDLFLAALLQQWDLWYLQFFFKNLRHAPCCTIKHAEGTSGNKTEVKVHHGEDFCPFWGLLQFSHDALQPSAKSCSGLGGQDECSSGTSWPKKKEEIICVQEME